MAKWQCVGSKSGNTLWMLATPSTGHLSMMLQPVVQSYRHPEEQDTVGNFPSLHPTDAGNTMGFQICGMGLCKHKRQVESSEQWCIRV